MVQMQRFSLSAAREAAESGNLMLSISHYLAILKLRSDKREELRDEFVSIMTAFVRAVDLDRAHTFLQMTDELYPGDAELRELKMCVLEEQITATDNLRTSMISQWHYRMLNDEHRNRAYRNAISKSVKKILQRQPTCSVLDIGSGTGLLAMMAVQAGATRLVAMAEWFKWPIVSTVSLVKTATDVMSCVCACEASPVMAKLAERTIEQNSPLLSGLDDRIQVLNTHSDKLKLPEKVDLIVTELFDAALYGEHCCSVLKDAVRKHLANGLVIPKSAKLFCSGIQSAVIRKQHLYEQPSVCKLVKIDRLLCSPYVQVDEKLNDPYTSERLHRLPKTSLTFVTELKQLDEIVFSDLEQLTERVNGKSGAVNLTVTSEIGDCQIDALCCWFELKLSDDVILSTELRTCPTECCWEQAVFPVNQDLSRRRNGQVTVLWSLHQDSQLSCELKSERAVCEVSPTGSQEMLNRLESTRISTAADDSDTPCTSLSANLNSNIHICRQNVIQTLNNTALINCYRFLLLCLPSTKSYRILVLNNDIALAYLAAAIHSSSQIQLIRDAKDDESDESSSKWDDLMFQSFSKWNPELARRITRRTDAELMDETVDSNDPPTVILTPILDSTGVFIDRIFLLISTLKACRGGRVEAVLPGVIDIDVQLIESDQLRNDVRVNNEENSRRTCGFETADHLNVYSPNHLEDIRLSDYNVNELTEFHRTLSLNLQEELQMDTCSVSLSERSFAELEIPITRTGYLDAVIIRCELGHYLSRVRYREDDHQSTYNRQVFCFDARKNVTMGEMLKLRVVLSNSRLYFYVI